MTLSLQTIKSKFKDHFKDSRKEDGAFFDFVSSFRTAYGLLILSGKKSTGKTQHSAMKKLAYNNSIVNFVTALEVYFRSTVIHLSKWEESGYTSLLKEKISLSEAFDLFGQKKVTRQFIVAHYFSFQNLESINHIFSCLTGKDFLKEIENYKGDAEGTEDGITCLLNDYPNWRKTLAEMYAIRNRFIHEGTLEEPNNKKMKTFVEVMLYFQGTTQEYFEQYFS